MRFLRKLVGFVVYNSLLYTDALHLLPAKRKTKNEPNKNNKKIPLYNKRKLCYNNYANICSFLFFMEVKGFG